MMEGMAYQNIPGFVPSGESNDLPDPPGMKRADQPFDHVGAVRWAFRQMMPHVFQNPADQASGQQPTMPSNK